MTDQEKQLFVQYGCDGCHAIGGGTLLGPDLINAAQKYDHQTLIQWIRDPEALYQERGQKPLNPGYPEMPALEVSAPDAEVIATYLLSLSGKE
jgi:cytochrome c551/c552